MATGKGKTMADEEQGDERDDARLRNAWEQLDELPGGDKDPFDPDLLRELRELEAAFNQEQSNRPPIDGAPGPKQ
jgi:hypothetical protein